MKRRLATTAAFAASILLFAASCAGAPKAPPTEAPAEAPAPVAQPAPAPEPKAEPVPAKPDAPTVDALAAAKERAEKSRKQAFDVEAPGFFPDDWKTVEATYLGVRNKPVEETAAAYGEATKAYNDVADSYDDLAKRALPRYAEARRSEIADARAKAIKAGIEQSSPERLAVADQTAAKAQSLYDGGDYYPAAAAAVDARERYLALAPGAEAYAVKSEIDRRGFADADAGNYGIAEKKLGEALAAYDAGNTAASRDAAEESSVRFKIALKKGREQFASGKGASAAAERKAAADLKANVAVKDGFEAANAVFAEADTAFKAEKYEDAADLYAESEGQFSVVRATAAEKRRVAEAAIAEAERRVSESEQTAKAGDAALEGGTR